LESLNLAVPILNYINITLHKGRPLQNVCFTTVRIGEGHGFVFNQLEQTNYYLCSDETTPAAMEAIKDLPLLTFTTPHKFKLDICDDVGILLSRQSE
jgi:hypothetical protein